MKTSNIEYKGKRLAKDKQDKRMINIYSTKAQIIAYAHENGFAY